MQQEDTVTFYSEDSLSKEMIVSTISNGELQSTVKSSVTLDLMDSEFFENYINQLILLEITSIQITMVDYDYGMMNTKLEVDNYLLLENGIDEIDQNGGSIIIEDPIITEHISNILADNHQLNFVLSGNSVSLDTFTISVTISFNGVFVD
jgi:hypothetical protein